MEKRQKNVVSKTCLFCLSDISLQRYGFANFGLILKKHLSQRRLLYIVTLDGVGEDRL